MTYTFSYYVSAPRGTRDAAILQEIESKFGSYLEKLSLAQKSAWLIVLMSEVVEIEIKVDFYAKEPIPESLFYLSYGSKLDWEQREKVGSGWVEDNPPLLNNDNQTQKTTSSLLLSCKRSLKVLCVGNN